MRGIYKEHKLTYALNSSGKMVHIDSVERGLSCNCCCPKCNMPLIAKLGNGCRQPHFAHRKGYNCHGSYMSALHRRAEEIIEEEKAVMVPEYKGIKEQRLSFVKVEVEQRVERKDLQPDIVGITNNGLRWHIEICNTNEVNDAKKTKLIDYGITCLEIDVSDQKLENLRSFLLESAEDRKWINNPIYESQIADAKHKKISLIERFLVDKRKIELPNYYDSKSKFICLKNVSVLSKSNDGLYVRVKAISTEEIPYIFNIGNQEMLDNVNASLKHKQECNELMICTDGLSLGLNIHFSNLDIRWLYNYEYEERLKGYRNRPEFDILLSRYCQFRCKYRPLNGKCSYIEAVRSYKGEDYVICNKGKRVKDEEKARKHKGS